MNLYRFTTLIFCLLATFLLSACSGSKTLGTPQTFNLSNFSQNTNNASTTAKPREIIAAFNGGILPENEYKKLGRKDQIRALLAEYKALENAKTDQEIVWVSESANLQGKVVASQPFQVGERSCRQYQHELISNTNTIDAQGTACRTNDGKWTPLT